MLDVNMWGAKRICPKLDTNAATNFLAIKLGLTLITGKQKKKKQTKKKPNMYTYSKTLSKIREPEPVSRLIHWTPKHGRKKARQTAPYICRCPEARQWTGDIEALEGHSSSTTPLDISQVSQVSMLESKPYLLFESLHIKIHISNTTLDEVIRHHTCNKISHHPIYLTCVLKEYLKCQKPKHHQS